MLIKIGYCVYARTKQSALSRILIPEKDLSELVLEALKKLGIKIVPTVAQRLYINGISTQVPTGRVIGVQGRISPRIGYKEKYVLYEKRV